MDTWRVWVGAARRDVAPFLEHASRAGWQLDAERVTCPVRIVWGTDDRLLEWPRAAARFRTEWLPTPTGSSSTE